MAQVHPEITPELARWIGRQPMFFVSTAPLSAQGHVNCSPKGLDSLRILDPLTVAYVDLTGSGAETVAHLRENGRILLMFCAFEGPPRIVRLHGQGEVVLPGTPRWDELSGQLPMRPAARAVIVVRVARVATSCGYGVPNMTLTGQRDTMDRWVETRGLSALPAYRREKNARSIDGLPALDAE